MNKIIKVPDLKSLPISYAISAVGMIGATAYLGFLDTRPRPGDTVVITAAAGGIGSIVGQIAMIKGCKVIGLTGSDAKVRWLEKELGIDKAFNYKKEDILSTPENAAPEGVDIFIDNIGGDLSDSIIRLINNGGRVCVYGSTTTYTGAAEPKATILQQAILIKEFEIKRFVIWYRDYSKWALAYSELVNWIMSGQLKLKEHITDGFEKLPPAFLGLLAGDNLGKAVVKV